MFILPRQIGAVFLPAVAEFHLVQPASHYDLFCDRAVGCLVSHLMTSVYPLEVSGLVSVFLVIAH